MFTIYIGRNKNGIRYVGRTKNFEARVRSQINAARGGSHLKVAEEIRAEGMEFEPVATAKTSERANKLERFFIKKFKTLWPSGCNQTPGGLGASQFGKPCSELRRERIRASKIGVPNWKTGKPVKTDCGKIFRSIAEAARAIGVKEVAVKRVLYGGRNTVHGMRFSFA